MLNCLFRKLTRRSLFSASMWLEFGNPTINNINNASFHPDEYCLVPENHKSNEWVYLIISMSGQQAKIAQNNSIVIQAAHPIHLHGHDFVILAQETIPYSTTHLTDGTFKYDNPARRDVALLPIGGYLAIAFRTDNPGIWIMHCHIAWHASAGLALQIKEREPEIKLTEEFKTEKDRICANWNAWQGNSSNWYNATEFQEDSGV